MSAQAPALRALPARLERPLQRGDKLRTQVASGVWVDVSLEREESTAAGSRWRCARDDRAGSVLRTAAELFSREQS